MKSIKGNGIYIPSLPLPSLPLFPRLRLLRAKINTGKNVTLLSSSSSSSCFFLLYDIYMRFRYVEQKSVSICTKVNDGIGCYYCIRRRMITYIYVYMLDARNSVREPITYLRTPSKLTLGASIVLFASMNRANCAQKITFDLFAFHVHHICNHRTLRKQL